MKPRHWAMLSTFITATIALATFLVLWGLKPPAAPTDIGSFDFEGTRTKVIQSGECQIFITKWKDKPEPRFFFSCTQKR